MLGLKCIAKVTPLTICIPRQTANNEPKFQAKLIFAGWDESIK